MDTNLRKLHDNYKQFDFQHPDLFDGRKKLFGIFETKTHKSLDIDQFDAIRAKVYAYTCDNASKCKKSLRKYMGIIQKHKFQKNTRIVWTINLQNKEKIQKTLLF